MTCLDLLERVTAQYLESAHFNGLPIYALAQRDADEKQGPDVSQLIASMLESPKQPSDGIICAVRDLVNDGQLTVVFGDVHPNPHIRAFPDESKDRTLAKLSGPNIAHACLYPTAQHLKTVINPQKYVGRPYALELALGSAQLEHRAFDMHVLEPYDRATVNLRAEIAAITAKLKRVES